MTVDGWGGIVREFGTGRYTLPYFKWITNKDLLYSTENRVQRTVLSILLQPKWEKNLKKNKGASLVAQW